MIRVARLLPVALGVGLMLAAAPAGLRAGELKVGDKAPAFSLVGTDGKTYKLSDFRGKSAVVLAWFPKAKTPGCTAECKSFRADGQAIRKYNVAYFTASTDTPELNKEFSEMLGLDFPILSDPTQQIAKEYGVVHPGRAVPERWTFYIDKEGVIRAIDKSVKTAHAGADVAAKLAELGVEER